MSKVLKRFQGRGEGVNGEVGGCLTVRRFDSPKVR